jgi:hypothetical protein
MALSPLQMTQTASSTPVQEPQLVDNTKPLTPSKTYRINFETGEIENVFVDGIDALKQSIFKAILTPRYRYLMYSTDYGSEIESVLSEQLPPIFLQQEIQRLIQDALSVDDRIADLTNFSFSTVDTSMYISFDVTTRDGFTFTQEVNM